MCFVPLLRAREAWDLVIEASPSLLALDDQRGLSSPRIISPDRRESSGWAGSWLKSLGLGRHSKIKFSSALLPVPFRCGALSLSAPTKSLWLQEKRVPFSLSPLQPFAASPLP